MVTFNSCTDTCQVSSFPNSRRYLILLVPFWKMMVLKQMDCVCWCKIALLSASFAFFRECNALYWWKLSFHDSRAWYGMEISVWNVEDARMEWNGWFQEWNERQSSILLYQFHTRFGVLYSQKNTYRCRVVINNIVTKVFNCNMYAYCMSTNCDTLVVYIVQTVFVLHQCKYINCNLQHWCYSWRLCQIWLVFFLRLTIYQDLNFVFLHRHENSYLLFHYRFSLI